LVTGHDQHGKSEVRESSTFKWSSHDDNKMGFSVAYTTCSSPAILTNDADLESHKQTMAKGLGLVNPNGSVLRCVDFAPGYACTMHRTKSLDYGIVLEGEIEMVLDSGVSKMHQGDIAVQRATVHQWRNTSSTNWARMVFVLLDCETEFKEDLGEGVGGLPPSGN
jgi:quercetin dioxygenase-like cupin family protein